MNILDRAILAVAPEAGLRRVRAKRAAQALMRYDIADPGRRTRSLRPNSLDADSAADRRMRVAFNVRDMLRNNGIAARAQAVITANTVGAGIIPSVSGVQAGVKARFLELVAEHLDTTAIDADGRCNLYGLQRQIMNAVAADGEVLVRVRRRSPSDRLPLPFQLQVLEADYLDTSMDIQQASGARIRNGIEYDAIGRRVAYHLYRDHPGAVEVWKDTQSRPVPASEVLHVYRVDRPGQQRGVSWFAPVALNMLDLGDYFDAQLMRQKIAACFAAFRVRTDGEGDAEAVIPAKLSPGAIAQLGPGEDIRFAEPPGVAGLDEFSRAELRLIAAGLGITYEALSGDLSQVNFSSARMGRLEMNANIESWQHLMLVPQLLAPLGAILLDAWRLVEPNRRIDRARVTWTPPARPIVDPTKEIAAQRDKVRAGFQSWQSAVREFGYDPETVAAEQAEDAALFDRLGLTPEVDPRRAANGTPNEPPTPPAAPAAPNED